MQNRKQNSGGMTLVELIVAVGVLSLLFFAWSVIIVDTPQRFQRVTSKATGMAEQAYLYVLFSNNITGGSSAQPINQPDCKITGENCLVLQVNRPGNPFWIRYSNFTQTPAQYRALAPAQEPYELEVSWDNVPTPDLVTNWTLLSTSSLIPVAGINPFIVSDRQIQIQFQHANNLGLTDRRGNALFNQTFVMLS